MAKCTFTYQKCVVIYRKLYHNGKVIKPNVYIKTNQLFNLGYFKKDEPIQLVLTSKKNLKLQSMELATLDQAAFDSLVDTQKRKAIDLRWTKKGELFGNISVKQEKQLLYLSVPYDENWLIKVNGEKVEQVKVVGNLMAIPLKEGTYSIAMVYQSVSFYTGGLITLSTLVGFVLFKYWLRVKKKREMQKC